MPFLTLRDLILPPPLPALIAIAFAASAASIARYKPAAFIIVIALLAALVNALAMAHLASPLVLRILTALFIAAGLLGTCGYQPRSPKTNRGSA